MRDLLRRSGPSSEERASSPIRVSCVREMRTFRGYTPRFGYSKHRVLSCIYVVCWCKSKRHPPRQVTVDSVLHVAVTLMFTVTDARYRKDSLMTKASCGAWVLAWRRLCACVYMRAWARTVEVAPPTEHEFQRDRERLSSPLAGENVGKLNLFCAAYFDTCRHAASPICRRCNSFVTLRCRLVAFFGLLIGYTIKR